MIRRIRRAWCVAFHNCPMWPRKMYECRRCGERFENPMAVGPFKRPDADLFSAEDRLLLREHAEAVRRMTR